MTGFTPSEEEPTGTWDGAGLASSVADLSTALGRQDVSGAEVLATGTAVGLDALAFVADPFGEFLSSAFGYLIEHVAFLREPLDALAGDPAAIVAAAKDWSRAAQTLNTQATVLAQPDIGTWRGVAALAACDAAGDAAQVLDDLAADARDIADRLLTAGAQIGVQRSLVRDAIATFLASLVESLVLAVLSVGSLAALALASGIARGVELGYRLHTALSELVVMLETAAVRLQRVAQALERPLWGGAERMLSPVGDARVDTLVGIGRDTLVETGKERAKADVLRRDL